MDFISASRFLLHLEKQLAIEAPIKTAAEKREMDHNPKDPL